jgi:hypothetical protein
VAAEIFAEPNFNSKKVEKVKSGTLLFVNTEKKVGAGGMGVFYKVKTPSGKVGYITDADLVLTANGKIKVAKAAPPPAPRPKPKPKPRPEPKPLPIKQAEKTAPVPSHLIDDPNAMPVPIGVYQPSPSPAPPLPQPATEPEKAEPAGPAGSALWGITAAVIQYAEKLRGKSWSRSHIFMGLRRTGNKSNPKSWRSDAGLVFTAGAPRFLSQAGAYGNTSGFVVMAEYLFLKPLIAKETYSLFGAVGPMIAYSSYKTNFDDGPYSHSGARPGLVVDAGTSVKVLRRNHLRADAKIYIEQTFYTGLTLTFQF